MFKNYLKIAWRNLFRNRAFSLTNLLGLSIGMTCSILILLWVQDELSFDKFHANYNNIYQVIANRDFKNQMFTDRNMVLPLAGALELAYPQIKNAVVTTQNQDEVLTVGSTKLTKSGLTVSAHFFDMFSWQVVRGNPKASLQDPSSIMLTASTAKAIFGDDDPIHRVIRINDQRNLKVEAVLADPPGNSSIQFDFIKPFDYADPGIKNSLQQWTSSSWIVYVQPQPGESLVELTRNINTLKSQHDPNDKISTYFIFPMSKWRLYSEFKEGKNTGGLIDYVKLFTLVALIILLTACVNFMNLSTARSEKRAKEVGIRKTLGSEKWQLVTQFFMESMILAALSFMLSVIAVYFLLPAFNLLVDKKLTLQILTPIFWAGAVIIVFFTGIMAGSYPALYLSSFKPVKTLKGTFLAGKKAALPRHVLVVIQFVISILLISATIIVYQQIQFVKNRDIGYNPNNLISVPSSPAVDKNYVAIKDELLKIGMIESVTRAGTSITSTQWQSGPPDWEGKPAEANIIFSCLSTDADMVKTLGVRMLEGRDFYSTPSDSNSIILNKAATEVMNIKNPIGMELRYNDQKYQVVGVTANIVMDNPFEPVAPTMIFYNPYYSSSVTLRLKKNIQPQQALASIRKIYTKYNPAFPFDYSFVDKEFSKKFYTEALISKITNIFAELAIFICCLGLAGLATFTIEKRIREIGIRKVLGATVQQILLLISKQFLKLAAIAFVIAVPLTWWLMNQWLDNYVYRISISIWLFFAVGILIFLLTLGVVSLNSLRAAMSNPVKSLRSE